MNMNLSEDMQTGTDSSPQFKPQSKRQCDTLSPTLSWRTPDKKFFNDKPQSRKHYTEITKGSWSEEEDEIVISLVKKLGPDLF